MWIVIEWRMNGDGPGENFRWREERDGVRKYRGGGQREQLARYVSAIFYPKSSIESIPRVDSFLKLLVLVNKTLLIQCVNYFNITEMPAQESIALQLPIIHQASPTQCCSGPAWWPKLTSLLWNEPVKEAGQIASYLFNPERSRTLAETDVQDNCTDSVGLSSPTW